MQFRAQVGAHYVLAFLSDKPAWNTVCEALMAAKVTVDTEFLKRLRGKANP